MKRWFLALLLICSAIPGLHAQGGGLYYQKHEYEEDPYDELTYLQTGVNYLSDNVYLGRKDSAKLPYISPYVGYHLHSGLYFKGTVSYNPAKKTGHFDLATIEAGYDRTFGTEDNILAGGYINKNFYYKNSKGIKAAIKESGGIYCERKDGIIEPQISIDVNYGKRADYVAGLMLDHHFRLADSKLDVIPAFTFYAGSEYFYEQYIINRLKKFDKTLVIDRALDNPGSIKPLDVDLNCKVAYRTGGWLFTMIPTYAIPMGAATIHLPNRVIQEKLTNSFYLELDVCYRAERK